MAEHRDSRGHFIKGNVPWNKRVASSQREMTAFVGGFNVIATDPFVSPEEAKKFGVELVDFNKLLEVSDV